MNDGDSSERTVVFRRSLSKLPSIQKTLAFVLASLQGVNVVVELKNDIQINGFVEEIDRSMTLVLIDAKKFHINGVTEEFDEIHINGNAIRYVHIPPTVDVDSKINQYSKTLDRINFNPANYKNRSKRKRDEN